ncbi:CG13170 [Drosophila busckii]|uniref:CG13170 n=2 Tax=Drosophila busckii TaxID=30019 RepID=A0A0M4EVE9_DROBS|nr:CG13170 [Drosophila busckii]
MGSSNLCKRFQNNCLFLAESCRPTYRYTAVNLSMCSGIAVGAQRRCTGLASNSSNTNTLPITIIRG